MSDHRKCQVKNSSRRGPSENGLFSGRNGRSPFPSRVPPPAAGDFRNALHRSGFAFSICRNATMWVGKKLKRKVNTASKSLESRERESGRFASHPARKRVAKISRWLGGPAVGSDFSPFRPAHRSAVFFPAESAASCRLMLCLDLSMDAHPTFSPFPCQPQERPCAERRAPPDPRGFTRADWPTPTVLGFFGTAANLDRRRLLLVEL